jgi:hypothetical protein
MTDIADLDDFDPALYTRMPRYDVAAGITLSRQILAALPGRPPAPLKRCAERLGHETETLQRVWRERESEAASSDPRPIDTMADNAWRNFHDRLAAYAGLPAEFYPEAGRAAELVSVLFPEGLSFLKLDYNSQWAESERRLQHIQVERLETDVNKLAGAAFLAEVRRCHLLYGEAIGVSKPKERRSPVPLSEPLRTMTQTLIALCAQLVALYYEGDGDQRAEVRAALRPIDDFRAAALRRARGSNSNMPAPTPPPDPAPPNPSNP